MPLTPDQRRDLLLTERTRDAEVIAAVVNRVLAENPDADLLEIEMTFRAAGGTAFLVVTADGFDVIIGMKNWVAALDEFGRTPEMNRQLLAAAANPIMGCHRKVSLLAPSGAPMPIDRIFAELHNPATWPPAPRPSMQPAYWRGLGRTPEQTRRRWPASRVNRGSRARPAANALHEKHSRRVRLHVEPLVAGLAEYVSA
jgi:hypothetical protein